jgi:hypothetical protein
LDIDTLHFADCHHKSTGPYAVPPEFPKGDQAVDDKLVNSIIGLLAHEAEDVKDITSLAMCACQIVGGWGNESRDALMIHLKRYKKLSEFVIVRVATRKAVEELGGEDGIAEITREGKHGFDMVTDEDKMRIWDTLKHSYRTSRPLWMTVPLGNWRWALSHRSDTWWSPMGR